MRKNLFKVFALLIVLAMVVAPASAQIADDPGFEAQGQRQPELLPQEVLDMFKDGMSVEEFLAMNQGPVPQALSRYMDQPMTVILQMEGPALAEYMVEKGLDAKSMKAADQKAYVAALESKQAPVLAQVKDLGGAVLGQYTKAYNGLMVQVTGQQLSELRAMEGVVAVKRAPEHTPSLGASVDLIGASAVWADPGYTGEGVTIAVIDTGIDYTHAAFGGAGTAAAYAANDKNVIEEGSFPTMKVIGGYDFAGADYDAGDAANSIPVPDPDPLDGNGHGTHVASTSAGVDYDGDPLVNSAGVAPDAKLYALKVFGDVAGSTNLTLNAIEWTMDPNGDGDTSDHVDVINMSLGSDFGPNDTLDPEIIAVENAAAIGIFIASSAGNAGDSSYVTGGPAVADSALAVAASTTGYATFPLVVYTDGTEQQVPYEPANPFIPAVTSTLADVDELDADAGDGFLCDTTGFDTVDFTGKIALIQRGECGFEDKINNAETLGAVGAIVYNDAARGDAFVSMAVGTATLPAGFIGHTDGLALAALGAAVEVTVGPDDEPVTIPYGDADEIGDFSSRGPRGFDSMLKPEISAPGVAIFAAAVGTGDAGQSMSGTSMASPHVAGAAALMKEAHPTWTVEQIKAALMNTAVDLTWEQPEPPLDAKVEQEFIDVPRQGAGRVAMETAIDTPVVAVGDDKLVSLSWGVIESSAEEFVDVKTLTLYNFTDTDIDVYVTEGRFTTEVAPSSEVASLVPLCAPEVTDSKAIGCDVTIPANSSTTVPMLLTLDMTEMPFAFESMEEMFGFVYVSNAVLDEKAELVPVDLKVPFYFSPRPHTELAERDKVTSIDAFTGIGYVEFGVTTPVEPELWAFTAMLVDENETDQLDYGDLRYVGMDYGWYNSTYGDIFIPSFAMYGPIHTNQPYFNEVDLYIDADQDGIDETVNFNFNLGWWNGADDDNTWIVVQIDFTDGGMYLASPYTIYSDFNAGIQEWYLPAVFQYVSSTFGFSAYSFDWNGNGDYAGSARFDITKPPLAFGFAAADEAKLFGVETAMFMVNDLAGYNYSEPLGLLLFDYTGQPGMGQAHFYPIEVTGIPTIYLPQVFR